MTQRERPEAQSRGPYGGRHQPGQLWYSTDSYLDEAVKAKRAERVNEAIIELGLRVGDFSKKVLKHKRAELAGVSASAAE